jgi:DNA-binding beta-propeller fold protein YncE
LILSLTLFTAGPLFAGTFDRAPLAPALGLDGLNRGVTRERLGRDLFADPYAAVTIGNVDVYDVFPYVESRQFQVVSDPQWNRLVFGEAGRSLRAFDGRGTAAGALSSPHGLAVDDANRVYVADTGNNRIVVLQATTEYDEMVLAPLFTIDGLSRPYGVAHSDGGTPFQAGDDILYVADTGRNRVAAFALSASGAREVAAVGDLGSGPDRFAGPIAVAAGRHDGASTPDVYVADAHSRRIVHLRLENGALRWVGEQSTEANLVTSLDTDHWGNVYAVAPNSGFVRKFNPDLVAVADLRGDLARPRSFNVPFTNVRDHRDGRSLRVGQPNGVMVEQWSDASGARLWNLGVDVTGLEVVSGDAPTARFTLTDHADVTVEIQDAATGRPVAHRSLGAMEAGPHTLPLGEADLRASGGELILRLSAASSYQNGPIASALATFRVNGNGTVSSPTEPLLLGNAPNPVMPRTRISFYLPSSAVGGDVSLRVFDASGRAVRNFDRAFAPGLNEVVWDGANDHGHDLSAGVYFYRLRVGQTSFTRRMVLVR